MEGKLEFDSVDLGEQCYINSLNHCKTLMKYSFRHVKGKSIANFCIINALCQNLANSESCN